NEKIAAQAVARRQKIPTRQQPCNRHVSAEVIVLHAYNVKTGSEATVQSVERAFQDGREERSRHHRAGKLRQKVLLRSSFKTTQQRIKLIIKGAHHAYAVFNLRIVAVMLSIRHSAPCAKINLIAQKSEGRAHARAKPALRCLYFRNSAPTEFRRNRS